MVSMRVTIDDNSGFCFGVVRAIGEAEEALRHQSEVYSLGDIVHNRVEVHRLEELGLRTVTHDDMSALSGKGAFILDESVATSIPHKTLIFPLYFSFISPM